MLVGLGDTHQHRIKHVSTSQPMWHLIGDDKSYMSQNLSALLTRSGLSHLNGTKLIS